MLRPAVISALVSLACAPVPCEVLSADAGLLRLDCPDTSAEWAVPVCGNGLQEAGEACDNGTRECTDTCAVRPGVTCTADDALCVCDPRQHPGVLLEQHVTFYFHWVSLNDPEKGSHHFDGANTSVPGEAFAEYGELGFDCDTGSTAPRLVLPPGKPHAFVPFPFYAVDARIAATAELSFSSQFRYYLPSEWLDRTLLVLDEQLRLYAVDVRDYLTPCLGDSQNDDQLIIEYQARGLWCPASL